MYNMHRLNEEPIPVLEIGTDAANEDDVSNTGASFVNSFGADISTSENNNASNNGTEDDAETNDPNSVENQQQDLSAGRDLIQFDDSLPENSTENIFVEAGSNDEAQPGLDEIDPLRDNAVPIIANATSSSEDLLSIVPKTECIPIVEPNAVNASAVNELISEDSYTIEEVDDMQIMFMTKVGFGRPFDATSLALIKRENDPVSGTVPFDELVRPLLNSPRHSQA